MTDAGQLQKQRKEILAQRLTELRSEVLPLPGHGETDKRLQRLYEVGKLDLTFAKLAEAHWDALAILAEAGREPVPGALYGVWASEAPGKPLVLEGGSLSGTKTFCSGLGVVDRALVTVGGGDGRLLDVPVSGPAVRYDVSTWQTVAFELTCTGAVTFDRLGLPDSAVVGDRDFYLSRPGFWHGACGPAACWAGGVAGLLRYAQASGRSDAHTLAHFAAMQANDWLMRSALATAGREIDERPRDVVAAQIRGLTLRHGIEQLATDTLRRFARAYGPYPLAMDGDSARRYQEAELFVRQSHGERDLESLARVIRKG